MTFRLWKNKKIKLKNGIKYDDRSKYREDKKVRKSHIDAANQRAMEMPIN